MFSVTITDILLAISGPCCRPLVRSKNECSTPPGAERAAVLGLPALVERFL